MSIARWTVGVYAFLHKPSGFMYIGSSVRCCYNRISVHLCKLRHNRHYSSNLQLLWSNSDPNDWSSVMLECCPSELCRAREDYYLQEYKEWVLNISPTHNNVGRKNTEETRAKQRITAQKRVKDPGYLAKLSERVKRQHAEKNFGQYTWTEDTRERQQNTPVRPRGEW